MNDETKVQSDQESKSIQLMPESYDQWQKLIDLHPYESRLIMAQFASFLEEERNEARDLLDEIFNITQIGQPYPDDLPMKALSGIAGMIYDYMKDARKKVIQFD